MTFFPISAFPDPIQNSRKKIINSDVVRILGSQSNATFLFFHLIFAIFPGPFPQRDEQQRPGFRGLFEGRERPFAQQGILWNLRSHRRTCWYIESTSSFSNLISF